MDIAFRLCAFIVESLLKVLGVLDVFLTYNHKLSQVVS